MEKSIYLGTIFCFLMGLFFLLFIIWHLGRGFGQTEILNDFYNKGGLSQNAWAYYKLNNCMDEIKTKKAY